MVFAAFETCRACASSSPNLQNSSLQDLLNQIKQHLPGLDLSKIAADNQSAASTSACTPPAKRARVDRAPEPSVAKTLDEEESSAATQPATNSQLLASGLLDANAESFSLNLDDHEVLARQHQEEAVVYTLEEHVDTFLQDAELFAAHQQVDKEQKEAELLEAQQQE
jgi:hypothetical protein